MLRHVFLILCVMSTVVMATGPASGATITDISALGGGNGYPYGAADGINASGQVTGCMQFSGTYRAFVYTGGTNLYNINSRFVTGTIAHGTGINANGQMSVLWGVPDKTAYYYTGGSAGTATPLVLPGGTYNNAGGAPVHRCQRRRGRLRHPRQQCWAGCCLVLQQFVVNQLPARPSNRTRVYWPKR